MEHRKGKTLKTLRNAFGYSQQEVADALGIPLPTYKSWEQGRVSRIQKKYIEAVSGLYEIQENDIREMMMVADDGERLNEVLTRVLVGGDEQPSPGIDILVEIADQLPEKELCKVIDFAQTVLHEHWGEELRKSGVLQESSRYNPDGTEK